MSQATDLKLSDKELELLDEETRKHLEKENPWDRVRRLYQKDEIYNDLYPEGKNVRWFCGFAAAAVGSFAFIFSAKISRTNYLVANQATVYDTKYTAHRKAMDAYMYGGTKRLIKFSGLTYLYTAAFAYTAVGIELYRMETDPFNYGLAGAFVGSVSRFILGPRAMVAASILGFSLGTIAGLGMCSALNQAGYNVEKRRYDDIRRNLLEAKYYEQASKAFSSQLELSKQPTAAVPDNSLLSLKTKPSISEAVQKAGIKPTVSAKE